MWNEKFGIKEQDVAERIVRFAEDEFDGGRIPQPIFIVGGNGSGKSTIIKLLFSMLEEDKSVGGIEVFDGKRFFCSKDIIDAIEERNSNEAVNESDSGCSSREVVMIDDLDYFFRRSSFEDQYILRRYLNREEAPLLVTTISSIDESLADYKAPFFEGIRIMYVPKFDESSLMEMDMPEERDKRLSALMKLLPPVVRSFKIASEIVFLSESIESDISLLLDRVGPGYRKSFESIPVNSQKILVALAASETSMSLSQLRQFTGIQSGILSSYLRQLLKSGIIRKIQPDKHGSPYELTDRLFKLWVASDYKQLDTYPN